MTYVYLLHFSKPYPGGQHPQHYLGVARDVAERFAEHQQGSLKCRLTLACKEKGIKLELVGYWEFDTPKEAFDHERLMKAKKKSYSCICPRCAGGGMFIVSPVRKFG